MCVGVDMKVGILLIATNQYVSFLQPLINSADKFLFSGEDLELEYIIFTNSPSLELTSTRKINVINVEHKPWPMMTLLRYHLFLEHKEILLKNDYLYYCDVDMLFINYVQSTEIIGDLVSTIGGFEAGRGTPETNPISTAYISEKETLTYYMGGFNGGKSQNFLQMSSSISNNIDKDLKKEFIATWHDESHLNRYLLDNKPTKVISPPFCVPEGRQIKGTKLIALNKDHGTIRT